MTPASPIELVGRLQDLRALLPRLAHELAESRRQAAALRVENRRLREENTRLRGRRDREATARSLRAGRAAAGGTGAAGHRALR